MKSDYTYIALILDASGSMDSIKEEAKNGIKKFLESQKAAPGSCHISFNYFDNQVVVGQPVLASELDIDKRGEEYEHKIMVGGMTALYDAVGKVAFETGRILADMKEEQRPANVLVVIMTDGHENSSHTFDLKTLKKVIKEQTEKYNWKFTFLGAGIDLKESKAMNLDGDTCISIDKAKMVAAYENLGGKVATMRGTGNAASLSYSQEERNALV